jgi:protein arginine kinase
MKEIDFPYHLLNHIPWENANSSLWPISTFTLRRNLARSPFPHKQNSAQAQHVMESLQEAFAKSSFTKEAVFLPFSKLSLPQKEFIFEHFFIPDGVFEDRPHQGLIIDPSGTFLAAVNLSDHLILHMIDYNSSWHQTWNQLSTLEASIENSIDYAFSSRLGFLTSNIRSCGSGLTVRAYLHLPALFQDTPAENSYLQDKEDDFILIPLTSSQQDNAFQGDLLILQNNYALGISEQPLLHSFYATANRLINVERNCRSKLKSSQTTASMKDLISRSFGILLHSYQIPTQEAFSALSFLKLGIDLGWIEGISDAQINSLFFKCRRGHLLVKEQKELSQEELLHKRAECFHEALKSAKLLI